jgi:hypothetical protein
LARRKRLKDAGLEDARGAVLKGKEERERLRTQRRELPSFSFFFSLFGAPFGFEANDGRKNFLFFWCLR